MESNHDEVTRTLHEAARAEAAPWTDYPPTPAWFPPACGLWAAGFVATTTTLQSRLLAQSLCYLALVVVTGLFVGWYRRYRGTMPDLRSMPRAFRLPTACYVAGLLLAALVITAASVLVGAWVGVLVTFPIITGGIAAHERAYAAAARRTKEQIG